MSEGKGVLIEDFIKRYFSRDEVRHRLPLSVDIKDFWPLLLAERRKRSAGLPLHTMEGEPFWYVLNPSIVAQVDEIGAASRREILLIPWVVERLQENAVMEEAVYSSMIEGAYTTKPEAERLLKGKRKPLNKSEQMVKNNYEALGYVLAHLREDITRETLVEIASLLTRDASEARVAGYRKGSVVVAGQDGIVFTPPGAGQVPAMMESLLSMIRQGDLHPVLKACIAHFYLVYVHPFADGNGRTARALSLMILLKEGFDVFRTFPISSVAAKERGKYYKAIRQVEEAEGDMTYFIDVYSGMLSRALLEAERMVTHKMMAEEWLRRLAQSGKLNQRQLDGAGWLLRNAQDQVTVNAWKTHFNIVTETARQDLLLLSDLGLLTRSMAGRKAVFEINRSLG